MRIPKNLLGAGNTFKSELVTMDILELNIPEVKLELLEVTVEPLEVTLEPITVKLEPLETIELVNFKEV